MRARVAVPLAIALFSIPAHAVRAPDHLLADEDGFVVSVDGVPLKNHPDLVMHRVPPPAKPAWQRFTANTPGHWRALWDQDTAVPARVFGTGIAAPGASRSPAVAERVAHRQLAALVDLLAPGSSPDDFTIVANQVDASGVRTVGMFQYHGGVRVIGGQLGFRFKNDRLFVYASEALPDVRVAIPDQAVSDGDVSATAVSVVRGLYGGQPTVTMVDAVAILPLRRFDGRLEFRAVKRVELELDSPRGSWDVWVDAATGEPVARRQRLSFASATLEVRVPDRYWAGSRSNQPLYDATVEVDGATSTTDASGVVTWGSGSANVTAYVRGPRVRVTTRAGSSAAMSVTASDGDQLIWDHSGEEYLDAQLNTMYHALEVKEWMHRVDPSNDFYGDQLPAVVNINDTCNAFSDGTQINFFRAGNGCGNTGRIADVVYHEFGHSLHNHSLIPGAGQWNSALSEGLSDYVSATITGDPAMGPGFFGDGTILRHCDPENGEQVWPDDVAGAHHTGKIFCGTMFDLRKNLVSYMGEGEGVAHADHLFYESFRRASSIPTTYVEALAADDDDGNLDNGTPNECAINEAFARHGMGDPDRIGRPPVNRPVLDAFTVKMETPNTAFCPGGGITGATLEWRLRGEFDVQVIEMESAGDSYNASMPRPEWGSVLEYRVLASFEDGERVVFPANPAAPFYEVFAGEPTVLACFDFEGEVEPDGFEHGLLSGDDVEGADDWQWGSPNGSPGSGDPRTAFSGQYVFGNDLGAGTFNGLYQAEKVNYLTIPPVDNPGYEHVRLHYRRWLNVEDARYDVASIESGDTVLWTNLDDDGETNHTDKEWRFHDVDLGDVQQDGTVQVTFKLATDQGTELGGWTIDDVCIVAYNTPECGNGEVDGWEQCDDANDVDDDDCSNECLSNETDCPEGQDCDDDGNDGDDAELIGGCGCRSTGGGAGASALLFGFALLALRRRRYRRCDGDY